MSFSIRPRLASPLTSRVCLGITGMIGATAFVAGLTGAAQAQPDLRGATITIDALHVDDDGEFFVPQDTELDDFFNRARCVCPIDDGGKFGVRVRLAPGPQGNPDQVTAKIWVGNNCDESPIDPTRLSENCIDVQTIADISLFREDEIDIAVSTLASPKDDICPTMAVSRSIYFIINDPEDDTIDYSLNPPLSITVDTEPPPLPTNPVAEGGEGAVQITWAPPAANSADVQNYQVLCADPQGNPVRAPGSVDKARYQTAPILCNLDDGSSVSFRPAPLGPMADAGVPDAGVPDAGVPDAGGPDAGPVVNIPEGLRDLHPDYLCGTVLGTETSIRVGGLQNDVAYDIVLVSVDKAGNPNGVYLGAATPKAAVDFWEDYHDRGGTADGGFCLINSTYGGDGPMAQAMRDFRDHTLASFAAGRLLIEVYYDYVAPLGMYVERSPLLRVVAAVAMAPLVAFAAFWVYTGVLVKLVAFALLAFAFVRVVRRRSRKRRPARLLGRAALALAAALSWPVERLSELVAAIPRPRVRWATLASAAAVAAVLFVSAASTAAAQGQSGPYDPYWAHFPEDNPTVIDQRTLWTFGVKLGPYLPDIDSRFDLAGDEKGPYEQFFGGSSLMFALELDRYFLFPFGQLGVTGAVGLTGKSADAFATTSCEGAFEPDPCMPGVSIAIDENGDRIRSSGDSTSFRMLPLFAGAVYRLTMLDDRFHVPIVPYAKAGLAYHIWWITQPSGAVAEVPTADCPDLAADCDGDRARGASLGVQATVGVSLRAERLDRRSALNLRNEMGIEHIGFYAELTYAKVDGFGADDKLAVGDLTWFGGLNFEF